MPQVMFARYNNYTGIPETYEAKVGEPFYDPENRRFGVFPNLSSSWVDWYPRFTGYGLSLNKGQTLSGITASGAQNRVEISFDVQGIVKLLDRSTGEYTVFTPQTGEVALPWAPDPNDEDDGAHVMSPHDVGLAITAKAPSFGIPIIRYDGSTSVVALVEGT